MHLCKFEGCLVSVAQLNNAVSLQSVVMGKLYVVQLFNLIRFDSIWLMSWRATGTQQTKPVQYILRMLTLNEKKSFNAVLGHIRVQIW